MAGKSKDPNDKIGQPPPLDQTFTLPTIMTMQGQLASIATQLTHVEKKLDEISDDVKSQGKWVAFANGAVLVIVAIIAFLAPRLWDLLVKAPLPGK